MATTKVLLSPMVDVFDSVGYGGATGKVTVSTYRDGLPYVRVTADKEELKFSQPITVTFVDGVLSEDIYIHHLSGGAYWKFDFEVGSIKYTRLVNLQGPKAGDATVAFGDLEVVNPQGA
jgi:hypothetical protein